MGKLSKEFLQSLFLSGKSKFQNLQASIKSGLWCNRLSQFLNLVNYTLNALQHPDMLNYGPFYLHMTPAEVHPLVPQSLLELPSNGSGSPLNLPSQRVNLSSFRFLLDQLPSILCIEFSGKAHDPFEHPDLLQMVDYAFHYNGAESLIHTDGLRLDEFTDAILKSKLRTLVINLIAHRPSSYGLLSGQPFALFVTILENVKVLLHRRRSCRSKLSVELRMTIDLHNYHEIPAMIYFAKDLGVNALHLDNYLPRDITMKSDRSLYRHQPDMVKYFREIEQVYSSESGFKVYLPKLLEPDMSNYRHCRDAYNTVSVDSEFNVSACSQHQLLYGSLGKIWDEDFFNNPMYQWLRAVFSSNTDPAFAPEVPLACQVCPRNTPMLGSTHKG